jgi:hypothetical protein
MKRALCLAIPLVLASVPVSAGQSNGNAALALAALVGAEQPSLPRADKAVLASFLDSQTNVTLPPDVRSITVKADKISCRMGDVDIGLHECTLTFGSKTITKSGAAGQMFLATMQENGVPSDGAAGTIFYNATAVTCTIDAAQVESHDGGGAKCTFTSD